MLVITVVFFKYYLIVRLIKFVVLKHIKPGFEMFPWFRKRSRGHQSGSSKHIKQTTTTEEKTFRANPQSPPGDILFLTPVIQIWTK